MLNTAAVSGPRDVLYGCLGQSSSDWMLLLSGIGDNKIRLGIITTLS